jgi:hypothetical protein
MKKVEWNAGRGYCNQAGTSPPPPALCGGLAVLNLAVQSMPGTDATCCDSRVDRGGAVWLKRSDGPITRRRWPSQPRLERALRWSIRGVAAGMQLLSPKPKPFDETQRPVGRQRASPFITPARPPFIR